MRFIAAAIVSAICFVAISGCTRHAAPPAGRWEGTFESNDAMIAARLQIDAKGQIFVSAPDAENFADSAEARAAIRQSLAQTLSTSWSEVQPRVFDFDGTVFRKPGGVAPQMEWDPDARTMTLVVYLGLRSAIRVPLHAVKDFSDNPWP